jgi:hypothetical protein
VEHRLADAAEAICDGDILGHSIYKSQNFGLLPLQGMASCIRPGFIMQGQPSRFEFPKSLGMRSTENKQRRLLSELQVLLLLLFFCVCV